jgi:hypothetical protein
MEVVGITHHGLHGTESLLGNEYLLNASDHLVAAGHSLGSPIHSSPSSSLTLHGSASTLVGAATGLDINLIWDNSVRSNANWSAIEAALITAAQIYTQAFSSHVVVNIAVGFGEIAGSSMGANALGESESYGYITNYSTVANSLNAADHGLVSSGLMSSNAVSVDGPPKNANFFITSAEAKAMGLVSGSSTAIDGYIGLTSSSSLLYFSTNGGTIGKSQYDAVGVAAHEISEVMGRIGMEGQTLSPFSNVYTPLDLFRYQAPNVRDLTPTAGYFSTTDGVGGATSLNAYNNPRNGGDAADWASTVLNDSYDAFGTPGVIMHVSSSDLLQVASLGYALNSLGVASINHNTSKVA